MTVIVDCFATYTHLTLINPIAIDPLEEHTLVLTAAARGLKVVDR
jgi:hypothetical protein